MFNYLYFILLKRFSLLLLCAVFSTNLFSQESPKTKKKLQKAAYEHFNNQEFEKALPLFLRLDTLVPDNFEIKYAVGACYLNTPYEKTKGIPYLEYAIEKGGNILPNVIFYDLGTLYHLNYQFEEAALQYNKYLEKAPKNDLYVPKALRMIQVCNNAKEIYNNSVEFDIYPVAGLINSDQSETTPMVSADEDIMYFTRSYSKLFGQIEIEYMKKIYYSNYKKRKWQEPVEISVPDPPKGMQISLAGSSPDGELLFFTIGNDITADIYSCQLHNATCSELVKLPETINSSFWEGKVSITPEGNEIFFSSNRPEGFGGKDLYKSVMDENGIWSKPINLGPSINTEFDEDFPFIHPDNKTLYFSSNGQNTLGGYDIFSSTRGETDNEWNMPVNLGYPLNTTSDDVGFVISADGNNAYLASSHDNRFGKYDIYKVVLHKTIPLTLIKGTIMGGDPPAPIKAKIRVVDHETRERLRYIYNPNPRTGKYLMIFPPNKNYDMVIEAEGYYPQLVNIYVPNQTYFYELFQEIFLKQIRVSQNDSIIGQEITVTNTFYNIYKTQIADSIYESNQQIKNKSFDELLKVVEEIINTSDSIGLDHLDSISSIYTNQIPDKNKNTSLKNYDDLLSKIEEAINTEDSASLYLLDANAVYNDVTNKVYFFDANTFSPYLSPVIIGNDTLYTLPSLNASERDNPNIDQDSLKEHILVRTKRSEFKNIPDSLRRFVYINYVYYESGKSDINKKYSMLVNGVAQLLLLNENLGIELHGYTDVIGDEVKNFELSKTRAFNVMEYLVSKQVDSKRIIMVAHGETGTSDANNIPDLKQQRRVEIKIFEVKK